MRQRLRIGAIALTVTLPWIVAGKPNQASQLQGRNASGEARQPARGLASTVRHVQIGKPIGVEIRPGHTFRATLILHPRVLRDVSERPVTIVAKELARGREILEPLIADVEIEITVVVVIGPRGRLGRIVGLAQNRLYRNNQNGTFTDVALAAGVDQPWNSLATWAWDYDNDGALDLFVAAYATKYAARLNDDPPDLDDVVASYLGLPP